MSNEPTDSAGSQLVYRLRSAAKYDKGTILTEAANKIEAAEAKLIARKRERDLARDQRDREMTRAEAAEATLERVGESLTPDEIEAALRQIEKDAYHIEGAFKADCAACRAAKKLRAALHNDKGGEGE